ncbi:hypothetical protein NDN08_006822 [Rhodosorus marinus]|uniref:lipid-A-disaccharide synthase n=1 Tax=Rhodosorus marinus TaxID=101924 RepID=A0AAV8UMB1_9RHOD|nr:hypothetical protein NDN08_006822 [Rhodosorus marinus]
MESEIGVGNVLRIEEKNLTRDTWIRYLGYANEIGESFKRFVSRRSYLASYLTSSGYVVADACYQCQKELERDSGEGSRIRVALQAGDSLIWQSLASVIVPGITINRIVALTSSACKLGRVGKSASAVLPTIVGLASIPLRQRPNRIPPAEMPLKVLLVAGEASGDAIGAHLISALRKQLRCEVRFWGVGGDLMRSNGMDKEIFPMEELSFMGFKEVFSRIPHFLKLKRRVVNVALEGKPDCIVFIDSNGFSGRVARSLKHEYRNLHEPSPPMFQYVAPSIWAWKRPRYRSRRFASLFDGMFLLYPFEEPHWKELGAENTIYVGSPLLDNRALLNVRKDSVAGEQIRKRIRTMYGVGQTEKLVALLPGSRTQEVSSHLGLFFEVLRQTSVSRALLPYASPVRSLIEDYCAKDKSVDVTLVPGGGANMVEAVTACDAAMAVSGTVVLETAALGTPLLSVYSTGGLRALMGRYLAKVRYASIPNILANKEIIPEFLGTACEPNKLSNALRSLFDETGMRLGQTAQLSKVIDNLLQSHPPEYSPAMKAAAHIISCLEQRGLEIKSSSMKEEAKHLDDPRAVLNEEKIDANG